MEAPNLQLVRPSLDALAKDWLDTKAAENALRDRRIQIEQEMLKQANVKDEGSATTTTDHYKVTTSTKLSRKVDWDLFDRVAPQIPENLRPVKVKRELDEKGYKYLAANEPEIFNAIAQCVTATPQKTGVTVKPIEDK